MALSGADTIDFDSSVFSTPQTITLLSGELLLTDTATTTISGPAASLAVPGGGASRVFAIFDAGVVAAISGFTIADGFDPTGLGGGGIFVDRGTLTLTNCTLSDNSAEDLFYHRGGGGIFNQGTLTLLADDLRRQGKSIDEIERALQAMIPRSRLYFVLDTLEFLRRGGRIGGARALLGELLQVKPILQIHKGP